MNYKIKSAIQWIMSVLPGSPHLNRYMQLYVTKSLPISEAQLRARMSLAEKHVSSYTKIVGRPPAAILDIGSGSDLALPVLMAKSGAKVTASDVSRLATETLIGDILSRVGARSLSELGIDYVVYEPPVLPFPNDSFDSITSSSVLEHVPRDQIEKLAAELHRVLRCGGVSTHHIAHKDHWSDSDPSLHDMNYLQYDEAQWRRYNPPLLHQNRLLSPQYVDIFTRAGFSVQKEARICGPLPFKVAEQFAGFPDDDLRTTHTWLTLRVGPETS